MFIINLIPLHVFVLLLMGRFSSRIYVGELMCVNVYNSTVHLHLLHEAKQLKTQLYDPGYIGRMCYIEFGKACLSSLQEL